MAYRRAALVAVLADVHGNLPALSAVLAEPDVAAADAVVLLGDIALGPMPAQTLEVLAGLGEGRGLILLTDHVTLLSTDFAHGEELQDHSCAIASRAG